MGGLVDRVQRDLRRTVSAGGDFDQSGCGVAVIDILAHELVAVGARRPAHEREALLRIVGSLDRRDVEGAFAVVEHDLLALQRNLSLLPTATFPAPERNLKFSTCARVQPRAVFGAKTDLLSESDVVKM